MEIPARRQGKLGKTKAVLQDVMAGMKPGEKLLIVSAKNGHTVITRNPDQIENKKG